MTVNNEASIAVKTLKTVGVILTVLGLTVGFFSKVHFDLETRVRVLEIETQSHKESLRKQENMFNTIQNHLIEIRRELGNKKNRDNY